MHVQMDVSSFETIINMLRCVQKCNIGRFMEGSTVVLQKMFQHFPLIPQLIQMYSCKSIT
jgi:hypothetical protein